MGSCLKDKVALVTGSGQGIGRAIAFALAAEGAKVVTNNRAPLTGRNASNQLSEERLARLTPEERDWALRETETYSGDAETTAAAIRASGGEAAAFFADITETGAVFMTMGGFIARYNNPTIAAVMTDPDGWTIEKVIKTAPETLFKDYKSSTQP